MYEYAHALIQLFGHVTEITEGFGVSMRHHQARSGPWYLLGPRRSKLRWVGRASDLGTPVTMSVKVFPKRTH